MIEDHLRRVKEAVEDVNTLTNLSRWISKSTKIVGKNLSYVGREYQRDVIDDPAKELYVVKIAQSGLSEILARWALASVVTQPDFTTIYTFPAANDAYLFAKARLDPIIEASKAIKHAISTTVNSVELKQFNANSFLYIRGTYSETGALSVPADLLIHDEVDRSDPANIAAYVSRLQGRPTRMRRLFSTPTVAKFGISALADTSKRKKMLLRCSCCNHRFMPNYHDHVVIPGFSGEKKEITKQTLKTLDWKSSVLLCPKCGKEPSLALEYREWVIENPDDNYEAVSYFISPFCAPSFITPPYLVQVSTTFGKWSEFCNQALGETAEDSEEALVLSDILACNTPNNMVTSNIHVMGCDMGLVCHIVIGREHEGKILVVHREKVFYTSFEQRRVELCNQFQILTSVYDLFPYTDMITRIVNYDPNAYGAVYVDKKSGETHYVKDQEEDPEEGKLNVRSAMINRNAAFDALMYAIKRQEMVIYNVDEEFTEHLLDQKRIQRFDKHNTMSYVWEKTQGNDHYHHAMLYFYIAIKLAGLAYGWTPEGAVSLVSCFRQRGV